jgi:hypothetical protein
MDAHLPGNLMYVGYFMENVPEKGRKLLFLV